MAATKIVRKAAATGNRKGKKRATAKLSAQDEAAAKAKIAAKMAMMRAAKAAKAEAQQRPATVEPDLGQSTEPLYVNKRKKENKRGIRAGKGATTDLDESSKSRSSDSVQEKTHDSIWENAEAVADIEVDSIDVEFDEESDSGSEYEETDEARPPIKQMKAPQPDKSFQQTKRKKQAPQIKPAKQTNVSIQTDKPSKPVKRKEAQSSEQHEEHEPTPSQQGSGDDEGNEEKEAGKAEESEILLAAKTKGKSGRRRKGYTVEQIAIKLAARRARNAFLARVRRAKARGLDIDGPEERPLKKQSIAVTEAPKDTFIPDLPSKLMLKGMTCADARRARNAFLARVRRAKRRGYDADTALKMAARPLPEDGGADNPVIAAALEALEAAQLHERGSNNESKEGTQRGIAIQTVAEATQALAEAVHATYMTGSGNRFGTGFDNWAVMSSKSGPAPGPSRIPDGSGDGEWESFDTSMDALDVEEELGVGSSPASALAPPATASASKTCTRKASMLDPRLAAEGDHPASEVGEGGRMTLALSKNDLDSQLMGRHDNFLQSPTNSVSEATLASATAPAQSSSTSHAVNLCSSPRSLRLTPLGQDYIADRKRSAARRGSNAGGLAFARGRLSSQDGMIASSSPASPIGEPEGASSRVRVQHASTNGSTATESTDEPVPGMRKAGCARQTS